MLADNYLPRRIPGSIAFGELSDTFINGSNYDANALDTSPEFKDFTTFTIVFDASGKLVRQVEGGNINFNTAAAIFSGSADTKLWDATNVNNEAGVAAVTMFDYGKAKLLTTGGQRKDLLDASGQFLSVNVYSGLLLTRK